MSSPNRSLELPAVQEEVPAGGATLELQAEDGSTATLELPAGAVPAGTAVTLAQLEPSDDGLLRLGVWPGGLALESPARLTVQLPGEPPEALAWTVEVGGTALALPSSLVGDTLEAELLVLGDPDPDLGPPPAGDGGGGREDSDVGAAIEARQVACSARLEAAQTVAGELADSLTSVRAFNLYQAHLGLLFEMSCFEDPTNGVDDDGDGQVDEEDDLPVLDLIIQTLESMACAGYQDAATNLQVTLPTSYRDWELFIGPLVMFWSAVQTSGASCPDASGFLDLLDAEAAEFVVFVQRELDDDAVASFEQARASAREAVKLAEYLVLLDRQEPLQRIVDNAVAPLLTQLRQRAWERCRDEGDPHQLSQLTRAGFWLGRDIIGVERDLPQPDLVPWVVGTPFDDGRWGAEPFDPDEHGPAEQSILLDIHTCATDLQVRARDEAGEELAVVDLGRGEGPGQDVRSGALAVDPEGSLRLDGQLGALSCRNGATTAMADVLRLRLDGVEVGVTDLAGGSNDDFVSPVYDLDVSELFALTPGVSLDDGGPWELDIVRHRSACDEERFGPEAVHLHRLTISAGGAAGGERIVFARTPPGQPQHLAVMSADGTGRVDASFYGRDPAWLPDRSGLVYIGFSGELMRVGADLANPVELDGEVGGVPAVSPDGSTVAYYRNIPAATTSCA